MKIKLRHNDSGQTFVGEGPTVLAAIGDVDRNVFELCGHSITEDLAFDLSEAVEALKKTGYYRREDVIEPELNFEMASDAHAAFAGTDSLQPEWRDVADLMLGKRGAEDYDPIRSGEPYPLNDRGPQGVQLVCEGLRELSREDFEHLKTTLEDAGVFPVWIYMAEYAWVQHDELEPEAWAGLREHRPSASVDEHQWAGEWFRHHMASIDGTKVTRNGIYYHAAPDVAQVNVWLFREPHHTIEDLNAAGRDVLQHATGNTRIAGFVDVAKFRTALGIGADASLSNNSSLPQTRDTRSHSRGH